MTFREAYSRGDGGPAVLWLKSERGNCEHMTECLDGMVGSELPFTLVTAEARDWNGQYSPWPLPPEFPGHGAETLECIRSEFLPKYAGRPMLLAGYSLAGLFALWAFYETGAFRGIACCSGSLWFDSWDDYADKAHAPQGSIVYLSLGGKEHTAPDPKLATIGDAYRRQEKRCTADEGITLHTFEMNKGGHFADPDKRTAKGIAWLLKNGI